jgi:hypothetical protein
VVRITAVPPLRPIRPTTESARPWRSGPVTQGSLADLGADGIAVAQRQADGHGWRIGSSVPVALPGTTKTHTFTVTAIHDTGSSLIALLAPAGYQRLGRQASRLPGGLAPCRTARAPDLPRRTAPGD